VGPLGGIIEVDETHIGGQQKGRGNFKAAHTALPVITDNTVTGASSASVEGF
jgi:hypothetical protein